MTRRDRTVLIVAVALVVVAGFWFLALSPKRQEASEASAQVAAAQERLTAAQASASAAQAAKSRYAEDYATVARLGKAVPVEDEVPSLVYQLESVAHAHHINFRRIALTASSSPSAAPTAATQSSAIASANGNTPAAASPSAISSALPPGATVGTAGFPTMPFSFDFTGSFFDMQRFLKSLDALTTVKGDKIEVKGRLLTVDGVGLKAGPKGFPQVQATVVVTAYLLPAEEGLAGTGTATSTTTPATASPTSSTTASLIGN